MLAFFSFILMRLSLSLLLLALAVLLYTINISVDLIPHAVDYSLPPPPPSLPSNSLLQHSHRVFGLLAPEAFAEARVNGETFLFMSLQDGRIARMRLPFDRLPVLGDVEYIARTGKRSDTCDNYTYATEEECGRPLGLLYHERWGLLVAESYIGVLLISKEHALSPHASEHLNDYEPEVVFSSFNGSPLLFANSIALAEDNVTLFLTDSSTLYHRRDVTLSIYDGRATGRLFQVNLVTRHVHLIDSNLGFPNGLVLTNSHHLLVSLTRDAAILQYDTRSLQTPPSHFSSNLPCLPDNLFHFPTRHVITVGCALMRTEPFSMIDFFSTRSWLRSLILRVIHPNLIHRVTPKIGAVLLLSDTTGEMRGWWGDERGRVIDVVSEACVVEREGEKKRNFVFLGSWRNEWLGVLEVSESDF